MSAESSGDGQLNRRSFIKTSAGVATGAAIVGGPAAVLAGESQGVETSPSTPTPREPVMAYVRDAARGEVTVMAGTRETTYRDPVLVKRLLAAAPQASIGTGGGIDVLAP